MPLKLETALSLYDVMCQVRAFEDRLDIAKDKGLISGRVFTGKRYEVLNAVSASFLNKDDILGSAHRSICAHFVKGITMLDMARQWLGRAAHLGSQELNVFGMISSLATMVPLMAGAVMVNALRGENRIALTSVGEEAASSADFHEGLSLIAARRLPIIVVVENNGYVYSNSVGQKSRRKNLADHAKAFGMNSSVVDGTDIEACYSCFDKIFREVRAGHGPYLVEGKMWRMSGRLSVNGSYVPDSFKQLTDKNDPLIKTQKWLLAQGVEQSQLDSTLERWQLEVKAIFAQVVNEPVVVSNVEKGVYAESMTS